MAHYDRRDLIGHWIRRSQPTQRMCGHACCRGKRVHPANYPVILPDRLLRRAGDKDLIEHWNRVESGTSDKDEVARNQLLYEMQRRDDAEERKRQAHAAYRARLVSRKLERAEAVELAWLQAEGATKGNMLNRAGKAAGIDERTLFTGSEERARRYASEELLNHWQTHPRPTAAWWAGKDTRLGAQYTAPRRRQYGTTRTRTISTGRGRNRRAATVTVRKRAA